ncbi:MAG: hypothetical protein WC438_01570 [Candidatus Pacearchaeota archaeon]
MEEKRKWSKLSIIAFACLILSISVIPLAYLFKNSFLLRLSYFLSPLFLASLVLAITSLVQIKKHNLKGKWLAILTIVLWIILLLICVFSFIYLIFLFKSTAQDYYSQIPLNVNISPENLKVTSLNDYNGEADIFILTKDLVSEIPEQCSIKYFSLGFSPDIFRKDLNKSVAGTLILNWPIDKSYIPGEYSIMKSSTINLYFKEDETLFVKSKQENINLLLNEKGNFILPYTISPFLDSHNNYDSNGTFICTTSEYRESYNLSIHGKVDESLNFNNNKIICLKQYKAYDAFAFKTTEDCKFFEISSDIKIKFKADPKLWKEKIKTNSIL